MKVWPSGALTMVQQARRTPTIILITVLAFGSLSLLVALRYLVSGRFSQGFLLWNLLLAAVPVGWATLGARMVARNAQRSKAVTWGVLCFFAWLLFYPNAPYIFTDFIHVIRRGNLGVPAATWMNELDLLWFDIVLNAAFAFVGHFLGLASMYIMHGTMMRLFGWVAGWALLAPAILLSGFGIHLGRFSRFNSWDLVSQPIQAFQTALQTLAEPAALLFSLAFSFFIALTYLIFYLVKRDTGNLTGS
ncbi:MAG: DUF1361 domain-containing protein [Spirochaetales bacterium]|nr:MAG: DUF1361 domain-containing protein [Spirochaetales bacterium]